MTVALFLDRDGVINVEKNYLYQKKDFEFIDGVFDVCKFFQKRGYVIIVVTNQAGIARGLYTERDFKILTDWMLSKFNNHGVKIAKVFFCPHHPDFSGSCTCRKPEPGMLYDAAEEFDIDLSNSILVGDKKTDMLAAKAAGIHTRVLVRSGHAIFKDDESTANLVVDSISQLIDYKGDQ